MTPEQATQKGNQITHKYSLSELVESAGDYLLTNITRTTVYSAYTKPENITEQQWINLGFIPVPFNNNSGQKLYICTT